jgi:SAM-dependent methyltransferase
MAFTNSYEDAVRAASYARLEFANTYYLAFRDLPAIIAEHVTGTRALDFGCGTGRSTRFVRQLGFDVVGVDIAPQMIAMAKGLDASGDYRLLGSQGLSELEAGRYDLITALFPFDNIPAETKRSLLGDLRGLLTASGTMINVVSSPEIYLHEWASFSTKGYPQNRVARDGDTVWCVTTDSIDQRPAEDVLCTDESYREIYRRAGLKVVAMHKPLATGTEPFRWVSETTVAPWVIYVLAKASATPGPGG